MTETAQLTLSEFLLARIAEDEAAVPSGTGRDPGPVPAGCWDEDRVLAECRVKRRIVEFTEYNARIDWHADEVPDLTAVLQLLALPYADHPDYRQEWRL